jgi:hypothetical protein
MTSGISMQEHPEIWRGFCNAIGAELREHNEIRGISGLTHPVQALAIDEKTNRLILVSAEFNPRVAALMQVDVQATLPGTKVLVARPIALDLSFALRNLFGSKNGGFIDIGKLSELSLLLSGPKDKEPNNDVLTQRYGPELKPLFDSISRSNLPLLSHIINALEQLAAVDWEALKMEDTTAPEQLLYSVIGQMLSLDNLAADRRHGICPIPTYELQDKDWELFAQGRNTEEMQHRLRQLGIYQYFFPPMDALALGLVEHGKSKPQEIEVAMQVAQAAGHTMTSGELVPDIDELPDLLDALRQGGYLVEGEFATELGPQGKIARQVVRFRPREGLFSKLLSRLSVNATISVNPWDVPR